MDNHEIMPRAMLRSGPALGKEETGWLSTGSISNIIFSISHDKIFLLEKSTTLMNL